MGVKITEFKDSRVKIIVRGSGCKIVFYESSYTVNQKLETV